jgi:hypothetical protein
MSNLPTLSGLQIKEYGDNAFVSCSQAGVYKLTDQFFCERFTLKVQTVLSELQNNCNSISDAMITELQDGFIIGVDIDSYSFITLEAVRKSHSDRFGNDDPDYGTDVCHIFRECLKNMKESGQVKVADVIF